MSKERWMRETRWLDERFGAWIGLAKWREACESPIRKQMRVFEEMTRRLSQERGDDRAVFQAMQPDVKFQQRLLSKCLGRNTRRAAITKGLAAVPRIRLLGRND